MQYKYVKRLLSLFYGTIKAMSAIETFSQRQQTLLELLLQHRSGLAVDKLAQALGISRNAVNQHLSSLENSGFVENSALSSTGGRPSKLYSLTENGLELFPRHYALISNLLIEIIKEKFGLPELNSLLNELGQQLAQQFKARLSGQDSLEVRIGEVAQIMQELGYSAQVESSTEAHPEIVASNCVFHQLAIKSDEVCKLDLSLLSTLLDAEIDHKDCIVKGGQYCRFAIGKKNS